MPRKPPRFEYGGYFLCKRSKKSPYWQRCWYDPATRQTRTATLDVVELEDAKTALIDYVMAHGRIGETRPEQLALWEVLQRYYFQHVRHKPTMASKQTQRSALDKMRELAGDIAVSEFRLAKQEEIVRVMKAADHSDGYIKRIFSATYAALNWAYNHEEIDRKPPSLKLPSGGRREFVATPAQLAALWDELTQEHLRMFLILAIATGARAGTVVELTTFQCDLENGLINLNPPGRTQTKKRRPIVPMTDLARQWIQTAPPGRLITWNGKPVRHVQTSWDAARKRADLPPGLNRHAIRHTVASWCRKEGVEKWLMDAFFGWEGAGMADRYAKYDPTYFKPVIEALDRLFEAIAERAEPPLQPKLRVTDVGMTFKKLERARRFERPTLTLAR